MDTMSKIRAIYDAQPASEKATAAMLILVCPFLFAALWVIAP